MKTLARLGAGLAIFALAATGLTACAPDNSNTANSEPSKTAEAKTIQVFAAASLKASFSELGESFQKENPDISVKFNFDGSSSLFDQMQGGAKADVFASADEKNMKKATDAGLNAGEPSIFVNNTLTLAVPKGNPAGVTGLDNSLTGKKLVICAEGVPCGNAYRDLAQKVGFTGQAVSEETSVKDVMGKVVSGEADAGVVYQTDALVEKDAVDTIDIPGSDTVVNAYPIVVTKMAADNGYDAAAKAFVDYVLSAAAQKVFAKYGFMSPAK